MEPRTEILTPQWQGVLAGLVAAVCNGSFEASTDAFNELRRMATIADRYVDLVREGKETGHTANVAPILSFDPESKQAEQAAAQVFSDHS